MNYKLSAYEDVYEVQRDEGEAIVGTLQQKGGVWRLSLSASCGWLTEEEVKSLAVRLSLLNMMGENRCKMGE